MDIKQEIKNYLEARKQMALATFDAKHPWICTVYYVIDAELNFYFLTAHETIHAQQFKHSSKVAITVADSPQDSHGNKVAVQLWGRVEQLTDLEQIQWFLNKWTDTPENYPAQNFLPGDNKESGVFKVTPKQLKYVNKETVGINKGYKFTLEF